MIKLTVELEGVESVQRAFREFTLKEQRSILLPIFKNAAKTTIQEMKRLAPVSNKKAFITKHRDYKKKEFVWKDVTHKAGELKRSIRVTVSKKAPTVFMGPTFGAGAINNAYYWRFVSTGHPIVIKGKDGKKRVIGRTKPNDYINRAWDKTKSGVIANITNNIESYLVKRLA